MNVKLYKSGLIIEKSSSFRVGLCKLQNSSSTISKRGKITKFSAKSALRLRKLLCKLDFQKLHSITLTLPKCDLCLDFRGLWHFFVIRLKRQLPKTAIIWRIELQQRSVPHWHLLLDTNDYFICYDVKQIWFSSVKFWNSSIITPAFYLHGVHISNYGLDSAYTINYFCSHISKHKKSQLGWQGRQWGVINRDCLSFSSFSSLDVTDIDILVTRQLRRLSKNLEKYGYYSNLVTLGGIRSCLFGINRQRFERVYNYYKKNFQKK